MKKIEMNIRTLLSCACATLLSACAYYPTRDSPEVQHLSANQAVSDLLSAVQRGCTVNYHAMPSTLFDNPVHTLRITTRKIVVTNRADQELTIPLGNLPRIGYDPNNFTITFGDHAADLDFCGEEAANDLYVLDEHAKHVEMTSAAYAAKFQLSLDRHRTLISSGEPLPEPVDMYRVQAEAAVRSKNFDQAIDDYGKGLDIAPWWPQGHFDRALVFDAIRDYDMAIVEMKYYLALVPDAANAKAAQYKIYEWQQDVDNEDANIPPWLRTSKGK